MISENYFVKLRNLTNSRHVDAQVEQHMRNRKCLNRNQTEFPPLNATHFCQPMDSSITQKLTCAWRREFWLIIGAMVNGLLEKF